MSPEETPLLIGWCPALRRREIDSGADLERENLTKSMTSGMVIGKSGNERD